MTCEKAVYEVFRRPSDNATQLDREVLMSAPLSLQCPDRRAENLALVSPIAR